MRYNLLASGMGGREGIATMKIKTNLKAGADPWFD